MIWRFLFSRRCFGPRSRLLWEPDVKIHPKEYSAAPVGGTPMTLSHPYAWREWGGLCAVGCIWRGGSWPDVMSSYMGMNLPGAMDAGPKMANKCSQRFAHQHCWLPTDCHGVLLSRRQAVMATRHRLRVPRLLSALLACPR